MSDLPDQRYSQANRRQIVKAAHAIATVMLPAAQDDPIKCAVSSWTTCARSVLVAFLAWHAPKPRFKASLPRVISLSLSRQAFVPEKKALSKTKKAHAFAKNAAAFQELTAAGLMVQAQMLILRVPFVRQRLSHSSSSCEEECGNL